MDIDGYTKGGTHVVFSNGRMTINGIERDYIVRRYRDGGTVIYQTSVGELMFPSPLGQGPHLVTWNHDPIEPIKLSDRDEAMLQHLGINENDFKKPEPVDTVTINLDLLKQMRTDPILKRGMALMLGATAEQAKEMFPEAQPPEGWSYSFENVEDLRQQAIEDTTRRVNEAVFGVAKPLGQYHYTAVQEFLKGNYNGALPEHVAKIKEAMHVQRFHYEEEHGL